MVKVVGGTSVFIETSIDTEFKMTAEQLEAAITPKTKAIYIVRLVILPVVTIPVKN
jgi:dTDP-4-amino-4,6-dideoxygalactose transaminase